MSCLSLCCLYLFCCWNIYVENRTVHAVQLTVLHWSISYCSHFYYDRDADFPLFSVIFDPIRSLPIRFSFSVFSILSYFIFLFLNFLFLFVFIFCETARIRRFSVIFAKVQWHPCMSILLLVYSWIVSYIYLITYLGKDCAFFCLLVLVVVQHCMKHFSY